MSFRPTTTLRIFCLILLIIGDSTTIWSQEHLQLSITQNKGPLALPDGRQGTLNLKVTGSSTTVTTDGSSPEIDIETYMFRADFVAHPRFTVRNRIELRERRGRRYQWTSGLRIYWLDPGYHRSHINPDGPAGGPVLDVAAGVRFSDDPDGRGLAVADVAASVPISSRLTGGLGYRFYRQNEALDAVSVYGKINLFFGAYPSGSEWHNPDGPTGRPVFRLTAGGSSRGSLAQAEILVPLKPTMTLSTHARYEQLDVADYRAYTAGVGLAWYPSH